FLEQVDQQSCQASFLKNARHKLIARAVPAAAAAMGKKHDTERIERHAQNAVEPAPARGHVYFSLGDFGLMFRNHGGIPLTQSGTAGKNPAARLQRFSLRTFSVRVRSKDSSRPI